MAVCEHFEQVKFVSTDVHECAECVAIGSGWVHLRLCMICGHVGCCDSSPNKHASKHFRATGDPVMRSIEPNDDWGYCFVDDSWVEGLPPT
jgi:uncharacterized UBP type Zn finger protein